MTRSTRKNATETPERTAPPAGLPLDMWSEQTRQQMEWGLQTTAALLRCSEEMRRTQLDAAHLALTRHEDLRQRVHEADDLAQLLSLQAELWRFDSASATRYWQDLFDAAMRLNTEMMRCQWNLLTTGRNGALKSAFEAMQSSLHTGIRPLDDVFQAAVNRELVAAAPHDRAA